jgi:hypothetical protein
MCFMSQYFMYYVSVMKDKFCFFVNKLNLLKSKVISQSITFSVITQIFSVKNSMDLKVLGSVENYRELIKLAHN